ncbi:TPA: hypothetical protein ACLIVI_005455 [Bacillus pacificus]
MKKIVKGLITVSLSTTLLAGCGGNDEKTTTTNTQEKSSQTQQKKQPLEQKSILKETENITNLGGGLPKFDKESKHYVTSVKDGYVYNIFTTHKDDVGEVYVSILDVKKNKWIVENKFLRKYTTNASMLGQKPGESVTSKGTGYEFKTMEGTNKVVFVNEKGEEKEVEGDGFVRTSKGDAAYTSSESSLKLTFENGKTQEFKMNTKVEFPEIEDYIDLENGVAMAQGKINSVALYDLKKGKKMYDKNGQELKGTKVHTGKYTLFNDSLIDIVPDSNSNKFVYLDYMFESKNLPAEEFITVKGRGPFLPSKDKLVQLRTIEYEGKDSLQYLEYKKSK